MNKAALLKYSLVLGAAMLVRHRNVAFMQELPPEKRGSLKVELAVKMHCNSCKQAVFDIVKKQNGVTDLNVDLEREIVMVTGSFVIDDVVSALKQDGRNVRVIGSGSNEKSLVPEAFAEVESEWIAAVGEFKGKLYSHGTAVGIVRLIQVETDKCAVEIDISGLEPSERCKLHIHTYGDTRQVPQTAGALFGKHSLVGEGVTDNKGRFKSHGVVPIHVWEIIGRAIVLYENDRALCGTVIARSAGVGSNSEKRLCTCDGTVIWEAKY